MKRLVYLFGEPGVGKSTVTAAALFGWTAVPVEVPVPHIEHTVGDVLVRQLGRLRDGRQGTDALGYAVIGSAIDAIETIPGIWLGEGDRLAIDRFFTAAIHAGYDLRLLWARAPDWIVEERRAARGSHQSASWIAGRITKAYNLADRWADRVDELDTTRPVSESAGVLLDALVP